MKAISLWQPWASLMAMGLKKNETRSWATSYRGPLLIHAAKKKVQWPDMAIWELINKRGMNLLPYGYLICRVDLIDCQKMIGLNRPEGRLEWEFGDYSCGRFMWITDNVKTFDPIPFRGSQGFFEVPDSILGILEEKK